MASKRNKPPFRRSQAVPLSCAMANRRRGLTLTELLVVIAILVVVTAVLAPIIGPSLEGREVREAARQLNAYFQQAQAKAKQIGRPVGVVLQRSLNPLDGQDFVYQLSLAETPPPYRGVTSNERASFPIMDGGIIPVGPVDPRGDARPSADVVIRTSDSVEFMRRVQPNDLIRFNFRGPKYQIYTLSPHSLGVSVRFLTENQTLPNFAVGNSMPFEVYRRPRMTSSTPLELPAGTGLVMDLSGVGTDTGNPELNQQLRIGTATIGQQYIGLTEFRRVGLNDELGQLNSRKPIFSTMPLTIMFKPDGTIERVYRVLPEPGLFEFEPDFTKLLELGQAFSKLPPKRPQDKLFLFIGKDAKNDFENFADPSNLWIAIDPENGLVNTAPHTPPANLTLEAWTGDGFARRNAIAQARQIAATGQNLGGQ